MSWVAVAVGAGSVVSGYLGSQSAKKAGRAAQQGSDAAIAESQRQFDLVRSDTAGQRAIGNAAINSLSRLYGYGPMSGGGSASATPIGSAYQPSFAAPNFSDTSFGRHTTRLLNPGSAAGQALGIKPNSKVGRILDPLGGVLGGVFGSKHGDEKRNMKAFLEQNPVTDLGNGMLALPDGTQFSPDQLQHLAGTWYGATFAPDGDQQGWQAKYNEALGAIQQTPANQARMAQQKQAETAAAATPAGPDMSVFFTSPDYQFNLGEGQKALDRSLAARGGALSGAGIREGTRYASGLASREYSSFVDRLMQQAGLGTTGIGASAAAGAQTAANVGNAAMNRGNAIGSAYLQSGAALNNSIQGGIQNYMLSRYLGG